MNHEPDIEIPVEEFCTLLQACEYMAFGWEPTTYNYEIICNATSPDKYVRSTNYANVFTPPVGKIDPGDNDYNKKMVVQICKLTALLEQGRITATGIEDPGFPGRTIFDRQTLQDIYRNKKYFAAQHTEHTPIKLPTKWMLDIVPNWIVAVPKLKEGYLYSNVVYDEPSYRDVRINFAELKKVCAEKLPKRHYKITLSNTGSLDFDDGARTFHIADLNDDKKTFAWLRYCFDNPNRIIPKQEIIDKFKNTPHKFNSDRITDVLRGAFKNAVPLFGCCFPVRSDTQVYCTPEFTELDTDEIKQ